MAAYLGSTLIYPDINFYFRNLDGEGDLLRNVDLRGKTITNKTRLLSTSVFQGTIINKFTFELSCDNEPFYTGTAAFGFFSSEALANQVGLDQGKNKLSWIDSVDKNIYETLQLERTKTTDLPYAVSPPSKIHYSLPGEQLRFLDHYQIISNGGSFHKGYVFAEKWIDPDEWYFTCHFYQDPVMPGSLGVESMIEAVQVFALHHDLGNRFSNPRFSLADGCKTVWKYRGQILPTNKRMSLEIHIKEIIGEPERTVILADTSLWKESMRIYEVHDLAVAICDSLKEGM